MAKLTVIGFRPEYRGVRRLVEIEDGLSAMQAFVGGYIQAVRIPGSASLVLVCDEEALLRDPLPEPTVHFDGIGVIWGPCFVCRRMWVKDGEVFVSAGESDLDAVGGEML